MVGVHKDPQGENIFKKTADLSLTNRKHLDGEGLSGSDTVIAALRTKIRDLENELYVST